MFWFLFHGTRCEILFWTRDDFGVFLSWIIGHTAIASTQRCSVYTFCSLSVFSHTRKIILNKVNALIFLPRTSKIYVIVFEKQKGKPRKKEKPSEFRSTERDEKRKINEKPTQIQNQTKSMI